MTLSAAPLEFIHSAVARRSDPDVAVSISSPGAHDVEGLHVQLRLAPPAHFTIEVKGSLFIPDAAKPCGLAFVMDGPTGRTRSPWYELTVTELAAGMVLIAHAFSAVRGTGEPLTIQFQIRSTASPTAYSVGLLSAFAIPSGGLAWVPGGGLTMPLVAGAAMERS